MANKFGAVDFEQHLIPAQVFERKLDHTGTTVVTLAAGGTHPKMRIKHGHVIEVDAANSSGTSAITLKHGGSSAATVTIGATDAIGVMTDMDITVGGEIVEAYEDIDVVSDGAGAAGDLLVHTEYEVVE